MTTFTFVTILIALVFVVCSTALYVRSLLRGDGFFKKTWQWIKNVIDSLMGMS